MQLLPAQSQNTASVITNTLNHPTAPSAPALVDTLRAGGPVAHADALNNRHPLESRLAHWDATQDAMHMQTRRRLHGLADPVKREMELHLVGLSEYRPAMLGGSANVHTDILRNKDWSLDWEDVYPDTTTADTTANTNIADIHTVMEHKLCL